MAKEKQRGITVAVTGEAKPTVQKKPRKPKAPVKVPLTPQGAYDDLRNLYIIKSGEYLGKGENLNAEGRAYFIFPVLERNGFDTWPKVVDAVTLMGQRKLKASTSVRNALSELYAAVCHKLESAGEIDPLPDKK